MSSVTNFELGDKVYWKSKAKGYRVHGVVVGFKEGEVGCQLIRSNDPRGFPGSATYWHDPDALTLEESSQATGTVVP